MGGNPGASGNSIEAMKGAQWVPTENADQIIENLMRHFGYTSIEELFRAKLTRFGLNEHAWAATVATTCKTFEREKIVPPELLAFHRELRLQSA
jgi:hypothetical protein